MDKPCEKIDPRGDVVIVLSAPYKPFAPWSFKSESDVSDDSLLSIPVAVDDENPPEEAGDFRAICSSKHLRLASPVFEKMLDGPWKEAQQIYPDGFRRVHLSDFDPCALSIILQIFHLRHRQIPQYVDTELLAKISILVDYLECCEAVEPFAEAWITKLKGSLPEGYNRDLVLWVLISSVFKKPVIFKSLTCTAILCASEPFNTLGLPIRQNITEKINQKRVELIGKAVDLLHNRVLGLQCSKSSCSYACDSMMLGALMKNMNDYGLLWPRPSDPFLKMSVMGVTDAVIKFKSPEFPPEVEVINGVCRPRKKGKDKSTRLSTRESEPWTWATRISEPEEDDKHVSDYTGGYTNGVHQCNLGAMLADIPSLRDIVFGLDL